MRYLLFGTGDCYERYRGWFIREEVVALIDNAVSKQNRKKDGWDVLSPEEGIRQNYDAIVILSFYVETMRNQLLGMGVEREKIFHFYDLHKLINVKNRKKTVQYYGNFDICSGNGKILLLNQNLAVGGPAFTLFDMAKILKRNGYHVVYGSMLDGPLKNNLLEEDIPVVVDENLLIGTMEDIEWISDYELVVCNAINFYVFLSKRDCSIPIIWWLHDSEFFYQGVDKNVITKILPENLSIFSVGPIPERAIKKYLQNMKVNTLLYGVNDKLSEDKKDYGSDKIVFTTIGFVESRKGQDILINAIKMIPLSLRKRAKFYIIGKNTSLLAKKINEDIENMPEIVMTGMVKDVHVYLNQTNVLICPSREDPMPAVAAEAMMHEIPCILSDETGTAAYIEQGEDGFVFSSGRVEELKERIIWCIENFNKLHEIGKKARCVYETNFSMDVFEKNLVKIIEGII